MRARSHRDLFQLKQSVEKARKLSDRLIGLGPFGVGLDGITAWIPGAGALYSIGAGAFLILQGVRARVGPATLAYMAFVIAADTATDVIPILALPAAIDMLFTGHKWAANALTKAMDETLYYEGTKEEAEADEEFRRHLEDLARQQRAGLAQPKRRIVYLG